MLISFGYDISLRLEVETPVLFCHPSRREDIVCGDIFKSNRKTLSKNISNGFGNICGRVHCKPGIIRFVNQGIIRDSGQLDAYEPSAAPNEVSNLPQETLVYLLPSRYCEVDSELADFAWAHFSTAPPGWLRVQAICDFVHGIFGSTIRKHERRALRSTLSESESGSAGLQTPRGYSLPLHESPAALCHRLSRRHWHSPG